MGLRKMGKIKKKNLSYSDFLSETIYTIERRLKK